MINRHNFCFLSFVSSIHTVRGWQVSMKKSLPFRFSYDFNLCGRLQEKKLKGALEEQEVDNKPSLLLSLKNSEGILHGHIKYWGGSWLLTWIKNSCSFELEFWKNMKGLELKSWNGRIVRIEETHHDNILVFTSHSAPPLQMYGRIEIWNVDNMYS